MPDIAIPQARAVLVDCPWRYRNHTDRRNGAAAAHYRTMLTPDLAAIPVRSFCGPDAVLGMWAVWPKLPDALYVMAQWGAVYVTGWPWIKITRAGMAELPARADPKIGIGFWAQATSEIFLIGRMGKFRRTPDAPKVAGLWINADDHPDSDDPRHRILWSPRAGHSRKPVGVHAYLEARTPGPYLELFATEPQPGWTCWGGLLGHELGPWGVRSCDPETFRTPDPSRAAASPDGPRTAPGRSPDDGTVVRAALPAEPPSLAAVAAQLGDF